MSPILVALVMAAPVVAVGIIHLLVNRRLRKIRRDRDLDLWQ